MSVRSRRSLWRGLAVATGALVVAGSVTTIVRVQNNSYRSWPPRWAWDGIDNFAISVLSGEELHLLGVWILKLPSPIRRALGLVREPIDGLQCEVLGMKLRSPVGLAAGFDKHAEAVEGALGLGFGFVEVGSVTPWAQPGNPKPRVWKLRSHGAVANCYGFNSEGHEAVQGRLVALRNKTTLSGPVGVNLGKNKDSEDALMDYRAGLLRFHQYADYLVVNVSSPNTAGLRDLQGERALRRLLKELKRTRDAVSTVPLLVKIAPDLDREGAAAVARVVLDSGIDGIVVSNTTIQWPQEVRDALPPVAKGGLSGRPLRDQSTALLREMYRLTGGKVVLIGVGGVTTGKDAYDKIRAGASLVQLYSAMAIEGFGVVRDIECELADLLHQDGFTEVGQAVGADHRRPRK